MKKILAIHQQANTLEMKKGSEIVKSEVVVGSQSTVKPTDPFQKLILLSSKAICFSRDKKIEKELTILNDSLGKEVVNSKIQDLLNEVKTVKTATNYLYAQLVQQGKSSLTIIFDFFVTNLNEASIEAKNKAKAAQQFLLIHSTLDKYALPIADKTNFKSFIKVLVDKDKAKVEAKFANLSDDIKSLLNDSFKKLVLVEKQVKEKVKKSDKKAAEKKEAGVNVEVKPEEKVETKTKPEQKNKKEEAKKEATK